MRADSVAVRRALLVMLAALVMSAAGAAAQPMTRCATCHFANMTKVLAPEHLGEWQQSVHAKQAVGCDKCHGGDPWTYEPSQAHRGVLSSTDPLSPVHAANLAQTCGRCHQRNAESFSTSVHHTAAQADPRHAPTCTLCHTSMRAEVPSPVALEARCASCHPAGSPRGEYPALMRQSIESLNALRLRAEALDDAVARVQEHHRRVELLVALHDARTKLKESIARVHTFDVAAVNEQLAAAQRDIDAITSATAASVIDR
jgi:cytochrome c554/c'-like protein